MEGFLLSDLNDLNPSKLTNIMISLSLNIIIKKLMLFS